jgi:hypothetical protein
MQVIEPLVSGKLVYDKEMGNGGLEYIEWSMNGTNRFMVLPEVAGCAIPSPNGSFVAIGDATQHLFQVYQFADASLITEQPLPDGWRRCNLGWRTDYQVSIYVEKEAEREVILFNVQDNTTIRQITSLANVVAEYEQRTPDKISGQDIIFLGNNLVIYARCPNNALSEDKTQCLEFPRVVIYDYVQQKDVTFLADASPYDFDLTWVHLAYRTIFSSPLGRYVLYFPMVPKSDRVRIFDVQTLEYVNADAFNAVEAEVGVINPLHGFTRNSDESLVGFWSSVLLPSEPNNTFNVSFRIFDLSTDTIKVFDSVHELPGGFLWSPDSRAIAFVNTNQELVLLDTTSGAVSVLDVGVISIRSWVAN